MSGRGIAGAALILTLLIATGFTAERSRKVRAPRVAAVETSPRDITPEVPAPPLPQEPLEPVVDEAFAAEPPRPLTAEQLTELQGYRRSQGDPLAGTVLAPTDEPSSAGFAAAASKFLTPKERERLEERPPPAADSSLARALRESARHFEETAAAHEERRDYAAADDCRETAKKLWHEARGLADSQPSAPATTPRIW